MNISERELLAMTRDMDEMHHDTLPRMHEAASAWAEEIGAVRPTRRGFLIGAGAALGAVALAACGGDDKKKAVSGGTSNLSGDLAVAALAAGLENLAVATYQAGLDAATAGKLGAVPGAVATFAKTAQSHHRDHAAAWNGILTSAGKAKVTGVDLTVKSAVVDPGFANVKNVVDLAKFALGLEDVAAATYLNGIQNALTSKGAIQTAISIQPVEMQHSAILNFVLGQEPVPAAFATTQGARPPTDKLG
ncbi:MAG TPA: ferritin-like domain-containing protein [Acidimicrobiales bacterium]|nr:ferritin-like domain-containing protein [Acidimicrobiales bacterium]